MSYDPGVHRSELIIWSGGQTGVDRGALAAALNEPYGLVRAGGYCPNSCKAEDGIIPRTYRRVLKPLESDNYVVRTEKNALESDGTVVLITDTAQLYGGTATTLKYLRTAKRPHLILHCETDMEFDCGTEVELLKKWVEYVRAKKFFYADGVFTDLKINFAGPRESKAPGIEELTQEVLGFWLEDLSA